MKYFSGRRPGIPLVVNKLLIEGVQDKISVLYGFHKCMEILVCRLVTALVTKITT